MKKSYTRKELKAICNAVNKLFRGYEHLTTNNVADQWVLDLQDINIYLKWNAEKQEFIV